MLLVSVSVHRRGDNLVLPRWHHVQLIFIFVILVEFYAFFFIGQQTNEESLDWSPFKPLLLHNYSANADDTTYWWLDRAMFLHDVPHHIQPHQN